jgi:photosystem II stability/assembly factor-like uncharacterized protein
MKGVALITRRLSIVLVLGAALWIPVLATLSTPAIAASKKGEKPAEEKPLSDRLEGMRFRNIGPFRGGRVTAVTGVVGDRLTYYFGGTGGGVWKTTDGGNRWTPMSDKDFKTGSVGAVAVAESDPNVVYAGMGEAPIRGNVSRGDGVYKSMDAGKTWAHLGLADTAQISRVRIHPKNPDLVYVAAQGHVWGANDERGIYRSSDGGKSWKKVLFVDAKTGASDLAMDPRNPRILYAAFWQVYRKPWTLESGGTGSGIYKSIDGGDTWKKLSGGLPEGVVGKIGVAPSPARDGRVWAIVEAEKGGVYRSDDGGEKWTRVNDENKLRQRAWYYSEIYGDPKSADSLYVLNTGFYRSQDGGKTFTAIPSPHGDNHDLWIDPEDPLRMIESNDGGANVSVNGGQSWSSIENQPTAQFYRVTTDGHTPYRVYGGQQDNTPVVIPSAAPGRGIERTDWYIVGGCESGWIAPNLANPEIVYGGCYGGSITRTDRKTGQEKEVVAWPQLAIGQAAKDLKYRFQWNAPIVVSRFDPKTVYHAAQVLLRSRDEGQTWEEASPDLTRNDPSKQGYSGGPITYDDTGIEVYDTIFCVAESPADAQTIWAGTDDGLVHRTHDGGKTWKNVTPKGIPEWIQINSIELSPNDKNTAYVAATMYKFDDDHPYLYKTTDDGRTWTKIVDGIPNGAFTRVIREDARRAGLLYAGTETGLYVSFDGGARWERFQRNLPAVPITDLAVKNDDLVVATQGRAFWILDDLSPLQQWKADIPSSPAYLFHARPAVRIELGNSIEGLPTRGAVGENPPAGAVIDYWLKEKPAEKEKITLEFFAGEKLLRKFTNEKKEEGAESDEGEKPIEPKAGLNRFVWDLRMFPATLVPKAIIWGGKEGPRVSPGTYRVKLTAGGQSLEDRFDVVPNPEVAVGPDDLKKQYDFLAAVRDSLSETHQSVIQIRAVKDQIKEVLSHAKEIGKDEPLKSPAKALTEKLSAIEEKLVNPKFKSSQDVLNFPPRLDHQFVGLMSVVSSADGAPAPSAYAYYDELKKKLAAIRADLKNIFDKDLADFNKAVRDGGVPPVVVPAPKDETATPSARAAIG